MKRNTEALMSNIKLDGPRTETTDSRSPGSLPSDAPGQDAREIFEKAMSAKDNDGGSGDGSEGLEKGLEKSLDEGRGKGREEGLGKGLEEGLDEGRKEGQPMPSAANLLSSIFASKMSAVSAPAPAAVNLDALVDDLVQRILVSDPKSGSPAEIRIQLNDSILPGTEITLQRAPDGLLSVRLTTDNASSMQTLVSAQQSLYEQLEKHGPVDVRVNSTEESRQGDNDSNRRSQGFVEYEAEEL